MPSGVYIRTKNREREKLGRFKIFGFTDDTSECYWYLGVSKQYLCKIKSFYVYQAKRETGNNKLFSRIRDLNYEFDVVEIEALPKDFTFKDAKLYLQDEYLDIYPEEELENKQSYCFCNKREVINHHTSNDLKKQVSDLYLSGVKTDIISSRLGVAEKTIRSILRTKKTNKKSIYIKALDEFKKGVSLDGLQDKYNLTNYMVNKISRYSDA